MTPVLETCTADYTGLIHWSQRQDGQWFKRYRSRSRHGWRWTAWRAVTTAPENARITTFRARLPRT